MVTDLARAARGVEEREAMLVLATVTLSAAEPDEQIASQRLRRRLVVQEHDRLRVPPDGVLRCERRHRDVSRLAATADRLRRVGDVGRRGPVTGELPHTSILLAEVLDRLGDLPVQRAPSGRAEICVQGVGDERV